MLFEKYIICEEGFGNIYDERGECLGFQLKVRIPYYRSVRYSLIDDIKVWVDGVQFKREWITVTLDSETFTLDEMLTMPNYYWRFGEIGTLTVHCKTDFERMILTEYNRIKVEMDLRISYGNFNVVTEKTVRREVVNG